MMRDMKVRRCGCIVFEHGPPVICPKHETKIKRQEETAIRRLAVNRARELGHDLSPFKPYGSQPGKWTAHCHSCGGIVIVYDTCPERGDQINGKDILEKDCASSRLS